MHKFIVLIGLFLMASWSHAGNGYCDGRPTQRDVQRCYQSAVQTQIYQLKKNNAAILNSPKLTQQEHAQWANNMDEWAAWVNSACRNDVCTYDQVLQRNNELMRYYRQHIK